MKQLILFPYGGNARETVGVVQAINRAEPTYDLLGFLDDDPARAGQSFNGVPVLGPRSMFADLPDALVLACPGRPENFRGRMGVVESLGLASERLVTLVHPSVEFGPGCVVGTNCVLMAGVVLTADVTIENHCVILPNTVVSHDAVIGAHSLIGSNVSVSGGVRIGVNCYIGSGSRIMNDIELGTGTLVGLGAVVIRSSAPGVTLVGNPARELLR